MKRWRIFRTYNRRSFSTTVGSRALVQVSDRPLFSSLPSTDDVPRGESGSNVMKCLRPLQAEAFFFQEEAKTFCRLCMEESNVPPKVHIAASSRQSHTNHTCREVVLDSLTLWGRRGWHVDNAVQMWSHALFYHRHFIRIPALCHWSTSPGDRASAVHDILRSLRDMKFIDLSLAIASSDAGDQAVNSRRRLAFERLECIGDNSWGANISNRMIFLFPDRQWLNGQSSYSFNVFRDACEMNLNLEEMYELLAIGDLLAPDVREKVGSGKVKADVLESILGELQMWLWGFQPQLYDSMPFVEVNGIGEHSLVGVLQHCLTEIYDIILLSYLQELCTTAIPLSKELASRHIWACEYPPLFRAKDRTTAARRRATSIRRQLLPSFDTLHASPTLPTAASSPQKGKFIADTIDSNTGADVFAELLRAMSSTEKVVTDRRLDSRGFTSLIRALEVPVGDAADIVHLLANEHALYHRERQLDVASRRSARPSATPTPPDCPEPYPFLAAEREGLQFVTGVSVGGVLCPFELSSLPPQDTKMPNAGVITDKNLYLGLPLTEAVERGDVTHFFQS